MARRLGRSGERRFATLVAEYAGGATCNDSHEDEHGWDHVVEFDGRPAAGVPAVFVQTKTTAANGALKVTLKLSNAIAFTRMQNPCFIVLVTAPAGGPVGYHAMHWFETMMSRTLRRARELHRDGVEETAFHRRTITFTMTALDEHAPEALVGWVERTVRAQGRDYAAVKTAIRDTLGFGDDEFAGTVRIGPLVSIEQLVDHQLGLTPSIPVERITLAHRRFDVDIPLPLPDGPPTFVRMQANPVATCHVRARGPDGSVIETDGELLAPSIPGLEEHDRKYRVRTPIFDLVWQVAGSAKFHCTFDTAALRAPAELEKIARFIGWGGLGEIEIMVMIGDERLFGGTGTLDPLPDAKGWRRLAAPLATLARLAAARRAGPPLISVEQALATEWLDLLHSVVAATETTLRANVTLDMQVPQFENAVSFAILTVGDWVFATLVRLPVSSVERTEAQLVIILGPAILLETYVFETDDLAQFERLKADYERHATRPGVFPIDNMLAHLAGEANGPSA